MLRLWVFTACTVAWLSHPAVARAEVPREYLLKAAVVEKLPLFFETKAKTRATSTSSDRFVSCILGENPFDDMIERLSQAEGGIRPTVVQKVADPTQCLKCTIVFISRSEQPRISSHLKDMPDVVTVSDVPGFAEAGGMVELRIENDRVQFIINTHAAESHGVRFFSQLLALAKRII